jgi:hypothetical protein
MYIFLDESGDLGFSKRSSRWFVIAVIVTRDSTQIERIAKKIWKTLRKKNKRMGELHAFHEKDHTRKRLFRMIAECNDLEVHSIIADKRQVRKTFSSCNHQLYNQMSEKLLRQIYDRHIYDGEMQWCLVVDRKDTKRSLRSAFSNNMTMSLSDDGVNMVSVSLLASHDNKSLQVADFVAWALFRKFERGDSQFYDMIRDKIVGEMEF